MPKSIVYFTRKCKPGLNQLYEGSNSSIKIKWLCLVTAILFVLQASAQSKNEKLYVFDKDWKGTDMENAVYLIRIRKLDNKEFLWTTYNIAGPRISQETCQDEAGEIRNGACRYYHPNGYLDSIGSCQNGYPHGSWWYYNNNGKTIKKKVYDNGRIITDSVIVPLPEDSSGRTPPNPGEIESAFKGGPNGWLKYLHNNVNYPQRAINLNIEGLVLVEFVVDDKGAVQYPEIRKSTEYSLDEEALRLIVNSPGWTPASKDGKILRSYKQQPVYFKMKIN